MNIRVIQPPYPSHAEDTPSTISFILDQLENCDESLDLILLPECCNAPAGCGDSSLLRMLVRENTDKLLSAAQKTAAQCKAVVGINLYVHSENHEASVRNTTLLFDRSGTISAQYDKQHLPVSEYSNDAIDHSYIMGNNIPICTEVDGVRYAFLTCYDMYYSEFIHRLSLEKPDVVLICSLQRAEREDILEMQAKNCAFVCNSYVVRSSYHMGYEAKGGGCSMVVAPNGVVLKNYGQQKGSFDCYVEDIHWKYTRSNGFGQPNVANDIYQTCYRTPWCYRVGGSGVRPTNAEMPFPRLCAHRGLALAAPENTIPAIGLAVALGAAEVEIDIRSTADGVPIISHDSSVQRLTGKDGIIEEMNYAEVQKLNLGKRFSACYDGVGYATLEEVFAAFPRRTIFNLHIQPLENEENYRPLFTKTLELAARYDCTEHIYFSSESILALSIAKELNPVVELCLICKKNSLHCHELIPAAEKTGCKRIQTISELLTIEQLQQAKEAGIRCNLLSTEDPSEIKKWIDSGVDCVLTDNYSAIHTKLKTL